MSLYVLQMNLMVYIGVRYDSSSTGLLQATMTNDRID